MRRDARWAVVVVAVLTLLSGAGVTGGTPTADGGDGGTVVWNATYGDEADSFANATTDRFTAVHRANCGYLLGGETDSLTDRDDAWLVRIDPSGTVQWAETLGDGRHHETVTAVRSTDDGGYLLVGYTRRNGNENTQGWIVKVDDDRNPEWQRTVPVRGDTAIHDVTLAGEGFVVVGSTNDGSELFEGESTDLDAWIAGYTDNGERRWSRTIGEDDDDELFYDVEPTTDDGSLVGYVLAGRVEEVGDPGRAWFVRTNLDGEVRFEKTLGNGSVARDIQPVDGGFVIGGATKTLVRDTEDGVPQVDEHLDAWVGKVDRFGRLEWQRTYGRNGNESEEDQSIRGVERVPGGYLLAGDTGAVQLGDGYLVKTDDHGRQVWNRTIEWGASNDRLADVQVTGSDTALVVGESWFAGKPDAAIAEVRTSDDGEVTLGEFASDDGHIDTPSLRTLIEAWATGDVTTGFLREGIRAWAANRCVG